MQNEKLEKLLNELAGRTEEPVQPDLADKIKRQIPAGLSTQSHSWDTIRIIIDLRVGRLVAAAIIIFAIVLSAKLFSAGDQAGSGLYQDSVFLIKYVFGAGRSQTNQIIEEISESAGSFSNEREVVNYGINAGQAEPDELIMHWKLEDGRYRVIYGDWRTEIVTADKLIKIQAKMLRKEAKR